MLKKIKLLEKEATGSKSSLRQQEDTAKAIVQGHDSAIKEAWFLRANINMPELYLDAELNISGWSSKMQALTSGITRLKGKRKNLASFISVESFVRVKGYFDKIDSLKHLPYDDAEPWPRVAGCFKLQRE